MSDPAEARAIEDEEPDAEAEWIAHVDPEAANGEEDPLREAETDPFTDLRNSERLIERHGRNLRYVSSWNRWLAWSGKQWTLDAAGHVARCAKITVREMLSSARSIANVAALALVKATDKHGAGSEEEARAKKALKLALRAVEWARASQEKKRISAMIALAESDADVAITHEELDASPYLFNVDNGTIDLHTLDLRPHRREDLITKITRVCYDAEALAAMWEAFLLVVVPDEEVRKLLQRFAGCCLTGDVSDRIFVFLFGGGRNGKSVFVRVLRTLLGDYAIVGAPDLLMSKKGETTHPTELADLAGARLVVCQEVPKGRAFNEGRVKELTGNEGKIKVRRMGEDFWHLKTEFKIIITGNGEPAVHDDTDAIWDRMRKVPFTVRISDEMIDKHLFEKLHGEFPGILAWAVRGCADWKAHGLPAPKSVAAATVAYRTNEDGVGRFLADCCVLAPDRLATAKSLADAAKEWASNGGDADISRKALADRLKREGCTERRTNRARGWRGVGLLTPDEIKARDTEETSGAVHGDGGGAGTTNETPSDGVTRGDVTYPLADIVGISIPREERPDNHVTDCHSSPAPTDDDPEYFADYLEGELQ